jgi:hypothetical protein
MADTTGSGPGSGTQPPEPQGRFAGIPYDWRMPTPERVKARWWNPDDRRLLTPRAFGWGYDLNLYWVTHPLDYLQKQQDQ